MNVRIGNKMVGKVIKLYPKGSRIKITLEVDSSQINKILDSDIITFGSKKK